MADTVITPTQMTSNTGVVVTPGAGTAINPANTMTIAYPKDGDLLITIDSDHADTTATLAVSDYAVSKGIGTTTFAVGDTVEHLIVIGESSRYRLDDGNVELTWATNSAGFVTAWYLPKSVT